MTILDTVLLLALVAGWLVAAIILWRQVAAVRAAATARDRLAATLTSAPGGYVSWIAGAQETLLAGLAAMLGIDASAGYAGVLELFADADRQSLDRKVEDLLRRGEEFRAARRNRQHSGCELTRGGSELDAGAEL